MPGAADVMVPLRLGGRAAWIVGAVALLAVAVAAWLTWQATLLSEPPLLLRLPRDHGIHLRDLVAGTASFGTAVGVVAAASGAAIRAC